MRLGAGIDLYSGIRGVGSGSGVVDMSFLGGTLPASAAVLRASSATYFDSAGVHQLASSNVARFDHHPLTLASRGLLIEGQRSNILINSNDLTASGWDSNASGAAALTGTGLNGSACSRVTFDAGSQFSGITGPKITTGLTSTVHTFSGFFKYVSGTARVRFGSDTTTRWGSSQTALLDFNPQDGTFISYNGGNASNFQSVNVGNGWWFVSFNATTSASAGNASVVLYHGTAAAGVVDVYGLQCEAGAYASSYIPTTGSTATRGQEIASVSPLPWLNKSQGSFVAEVEGQPRTSSQRLLSCHVGTSEVDMIGLNASPAGTTWFVRENSNYTANLVFSALTPYVTSKVAGRYNTDDFAGSLNGGTVATDTSGALPTVTLDTMYIGNRNGGAGTQIFDGWFRKITYYPYALTDAQLQALTT